MLKGLRILCVLKIGFICLVISLTAFLSMSEKKVSGEKLVTYEEEKGNSYGENLGQALDLKSSIIISLGLASSISIGKIGRKLMI